MSGKEEKRIQPIVGYHAAWGLISSKYGIKPYTLSPGATEILRVRVREKIDVFGTGMDVIEMEGTFTVRRDHPTSRGKPSWKKSHIKFEFRALELYGESPIFGTVRVHLNPDFASHGEVGPTRRESLAGACRAELYPVIELPELNLRLTTGSEAVILASKVVQIPPIGDVARSENCPELIDELANVVGEFVSSDVEVGEVISSIPLGYTSPRSAPSGHKPNGPSGEAFFTRKLPHEK